VIFGVFFLVEWWSGKAKQQQRNILKPMNEALGMRMNDDE
jgi:hypothetical protein